MNVNMYTDQEIKLFLSHFYLVTDAKITLNKNSNHALLLMITMLIYIPFIFILLFNMKRKNSM